MAPLFQALGLPTAFLLAACAETPPMTLIDCTPISVTVGGKALEGIEDMAVLGPGSLLLSAYNRRDFAASLSGLFQLEVDQSGQTWTAKRLNGQATDLQPHGINVDRSRNTLHVVDRSTSQPRLLAYKIAPDATLSQQQTRLSEETWNHDAPYPCNLNDIASMEDGSIVFTNDRKACSGLGRIFSNVFNRATGSLWRMEADDSVTQLDGGLSFPNGVAVTNDEQVWTAQTRAHTLTSQTSGAQYALPGAPDNVSADAGNDTLWAAVIPSLFRYGLYRSGLASSAGPSRAAAISGSAAVYETTEYTGATSVISLGGSLYLSGAFTAGLAHCKQPNV